MIAAWVVPLSGFWVLQYWMHLWEKGILKLNGVLLTKLSKSALCSKQAGLISRA